MTPRLKELYLKEIQPNLKSQFGLKNLYMGPKIEKIILNMGLGLDGNDNKILKSCEEDLAKITGQKPVITKFKKSVANFKTFFNHYKTSGANEIIFICPLFLNSLVTGPKILVPTGSPLSSTRTAALLSNFTFDPSSL